MKALIFFAVVAVECLGIEIYRRYRARWMNVRYGTLLKDGREILMVTAVRPKHFDTPVEAANVATGSFRVYTIEQANTLRWSN